jgi:uncharacterized alkaline shock family protein YloU
MTTNQESAVKQESAVETGAGVSAPPTSRTQKRPSPTAGHEMVTALGRTTIADVVVAKIAGLATREVSGVYDLGGGAARAIGALRERVGQATPATGVHVEVGEKQAAVDLDLIVEYGAPIHQVADAVRDNVIGAIERMTPLVVKEVNITVHDLHLEGEETEAAATPRVQ